MSSSTTRDQTDDHLITPENATLMIVDYQPIQVNSINSMDRQELVRNIVNTAKIAIAYKLPIVLSTVNVKTGANKETIPQLREVLKAIPSHDRTSINAWEDTQVLAAVRASGRRKLLMTALWTEACLSFPALDAIDEGYEVYPIVDAVGGTSLTAHETALRRMEQAGAQLTTWAQILCELQRDWSRTATVPSMVEIFTNAGIFPRPESE